MLLSSEKKRMMDVLKQTELTVQPPSVAGWVGAGVVGRVSAPPTFTGAHGPPVLTRVIWDEDCRVEHRLLARTSTDLF